MFSADNIAVTSGSFSAGYLEIEIVTAGHVKNPYVAWMTGGNSL